MSSQKVLLLGVTGQTGGSVLDGLLKEGGFEVAALVRPSSLEKPAVKDAKSRNVTIIEGDSTDDVSKLTQHLKGFDVIISTIDAASQLAQRNLVEAAAAAGVKRFVPCGFITISPPGGIMMLRDAKEEIHNLIFQLHLPYTIIDVGFWHVLSFPPLPSGKVDYAAFVSSNTTIYGDGTAPNLLTHLPDIGTYVAKIVKDPRTLNKRVVTWSDELSQNQIFEMMEEVSGEKLERHYKSGEQVQAELEEAKKAFAATDPQSGPSGLTLAGVKVVTGQYIYSKFIRKDNTLENAKYLGYLDAKELYPDFKPTTFREFLKDELLVGKTIKPYQNLTLPTK